MIKASVFEAALKNGHRLTAVSRGLGGLSEGDRVVIEVSPCAMAQGAIVGKQDCGGESSE